MSSKAGITGILLLAGCLSLLEPVETVAEELVTHEQLLPAARAYNNLMLCANTAHNYLSDESLGDQYSKLAWDLSDAITGTDSKWSDDEFLKALMAAQEEKSEMSFRPGESRERFNLRHYSGEPCQREQMNAADLLRRWSHL